MKDLIVNQSTKEKNTMDENMIQEEYASQFASLRASILENLQTAMEIAENYFGTDLDTLTFFQVMKAEKADDELEKLLKLFHRIELDC